MSQEEIEQWFIQYFDTLARFYGTGAAYIQAREALRQRAAEVAAPALPAAPLQPALADQGITIASMPSAQAPAPGAQLAMALPCSVPG